VEGVDVKAHQWSSPLQMTRLQLSIGSHISAFGLRERSKGGAVRTSIFDAHGELVAVEKGGQLYKVGQPNQTDNPQLCIRPLRSAHMKQVVAGWWLVSVW